MKELTGYYVSRAVVALVAAALAWTATRSIWVTAATGTLTMAAFVWYAHSGHFVMEPNRPLSPLRRDEREETITYQAATYGFVVVMLALGLLGIAGQIGQPWASAIILIGFAVYFIARAWLRRAM